MDLHTLCEKRKVVTPHGLPPKATKGSMSCRSLGSVRLWDSRRSNAKKGRASLKSLEVTPPSGEEEVTKSVNFNCVHLNLEELKQEATVLQNAKEIEDAV